MYSRFISCIILKYYFLATLEHLTKYYLNEKLTIIKTNNCWLFLYEKNKFKPLLCLSAILTSNLETYCPVNNLIFYINTYFQISTQNFNISNSNYINWSNKKCVSLKSKQKKIWWKIFGFVVLLKSWNHFEVRIVRSIIIM